MGPFLLFGAVATFFIVAASLATPTTNGGLLCPKKGRIEKVLKCDQGHECKVLLETGFHGSAYRPSVGDVHVEWVPCEDK
jgi:hypothetical protein